MDNKIEKDADYKVIEDKKEIPIPQPAPPKAQLNPQQYSNNVVKVIVTTFIILTLVLLVLLLIIGFNRRIFTVNPDPNTYSNYLEFATKHYSIVWNIDFEQTKFNGSVKLTLDCKKNDSKEVFLDTKNLSIGRISDQDNNDLAWFLENNPNDHLYGKRLRITLLQPCNSGSQTLIIIDYNTSSNAGALSWLPANQTASKLMPIVYSQCQSIEARSLLPIQDTPGVKSMWTAEIFVLKNQNIPEQPNVYMSGNLTFNESRGRWVYFKYESTVEVPSYLFAIVAGHLYNASLGKRTSVIADPLSLEKAAKELEDLEDYVAKFENHLTKYE